MRGGGGNVYCEVGVSVGVEVGKREGAAVSMICMHSKASKRRAGWRAAETTEARACLLSLLAKSSHGCSSSDPFGTIEWMASGAVDGVPD